MRNQLLVLSTVIAGALSCNALPEDELGTDSSSGALNPIFCSVLDEKQCSATPGCVVDAIVCDNICAVQPDGKTCPPCPSKYLGCRAAPSRCNSFDEKTCSAEASYCQWVGSVCPAICKVRSGGDGTCEPCNAKGSCEAKVKPLPPPTPITKCDSLDEKSCYATSTCQWSGGVCPAICKLLSDGGCEPCNAVGQCSTKPTTPPPPHTKCWGNDEKTCGTIKGCYASYPVCTMVCKLLADGGCEPCPTTYLGCMGD